MQELKVIEMKGMRVLTTQQIAEAYGANVQLIKNNYNYNKQRYQEGKHYIAVQGEELRQFKAGFEIQTNLKYAHILYLWTEKGALLHAKSLNTDKAWEVYDHLVDFYFRSKRETLPIKNETKALEMVNTNLPKRKGIDIAPLFREILIEMSLDTLDEMEKVLRPGEDKSIKLATIAILTEKIKRQIV